MAALFDAGRFNDAAAVYDAHIGQEAPAFDASLLRARLYLRSNPPQALAVLNTLHPRSGTADFALREMLLGEVTALVSDFEAADAHFERALATARGLKDAELVANVGYRIGRRFIMANLPQQAREALDLARSGHSPEAALDAMHLETFVLSREGRPREQATLLIELLARIDPDKIRHMEHRAWATHTLATLARELYLPDAVPAVERQLGGTAWTNDLRINRFQAAKALGWAKALQGDYFNAFRYLKESRSVATDDAWLTMAFCDRAYLAAAIGEERWARQELLEAEECAQRVDWNSCRGEQSVALLLLAELFVRIDPAKASVFVAKFRENGDLRDARLLYRDDSRFKALVTYTTGVVEAALGQRAIAKRRFEETYETYSALGYEWRAARSALRLFDLTQNQNYLRTAEEKLHNYSSSWLFDELRARRGHAGNGPALPPMQQRVFRYLCQGLSNAQIAAELGRSEFTVANHAKAVLKAFGVSSRSALIAQAMKRGLI
jgi:DNA-binding CsgD family transcriptional regulator